MGNILSLGKWSTVHILEDVYWRNHFSFTLKLGRERQIWRCDIGKEDEDSGKEEKINHTALKNDMNQIKIT